MTRCALLLCCAASVAGGQARTGIAAVDSARTARAAWAQANKRLNDRDLASARREVDHAAKAWPIQPAYLWASAVLASRARDTASALAALAAYADRGLGRDVRADSLLASYARLPRFAPVVARHDANRAPLERSRVVARFADSTLWPEGMDFDPRTRRYYVASVRNRTIVEVTATGSTREILPRGAKGVAAILGVRVDTARGVLWATTSSVRASGDDGAPVAALLRVRIADGAIERRWDLAPTTDGAAHTLGDLAVGPRGDVYVTDSTDPVLYRLRSGADTLERITSPLFYSLQGVAPSADGRALYLADYSHGLLRVDLTTGRVARVADAPHTTTVGCDGIALDRGAIVAVQNGVAPPRIVRFELDSAGTRVTRADVLDRATLADEPTIGAVVGREFVYVANSQWDKHGDDGTLRAGAKLTAPLLLAVPLPR